MAVVYLAHDLRHDRPVAIKVLSQPRPATTDDERFSREIRMAAQLSHPHILTLAEALDRSDKVGATARRVDWQPFASGRLTLQLVPVVTARALVS